RIRQGFRHPTLGDVGGWEAAVTRSFVAAGRSYLDVEISGKSLASLSAQEKHKFFEDKVVFTRIRLTDTDVDFISLPETEAARLGAIRKIHWEWYLQFGKQEPDPTKFESDEAYDTDGEADSGRRTALKYLAATGAVLLLMYMNNCNQDNDNRSGGTWGHGGGYYG